MKLWAPTHFDGGRLKIDPLNLRLSKREANDDCHDGYAVQVKIVLPPQSRASLTKQSRKIREANR